MYSRCVVLFLVLFLSLNKSYGHIPQYYYEWAEPSGAISDVGGGQMRTLGYDESYRRLEAVRSVMTAYNVDAYIVPTADSHNSQYIAPSDARREWVSGMTGSAGTAAVTSSVALLWTDSRYYTQFEIEVDATLWTLMRSGQDASMQAWLATNMPPNSRVGVDPATFTRSSWTPLESALAAVNVTLVAIEANLVDIARTNINDPAPSRPSNDIIVQPIEFSGRLASDKISEIRLRMLASSASVLVLTPLDQVAYTLNLRGSDIPYNPVFFAYLVIRNDENSQEITLFWNDGQLSTAVQNHLSSEGVTLTVRPYNDIFDYLRNLSTSLPFGSIIWLSQDGSEAIYQAAEYGSGTTIISTVSPVDLMKYVKNDVELRGFRNAHIKDGIAVVRFMRWIHEQIDAGNTVTEIDVSDKLDEFRSEEADYMGPSFATIAGAGENGAIIHYKPSREGEQRVVRSDDMLLFDSGAQYRDGTTDITRTRHMGTPTDMQITTFTRVLKGQILMGTAVFPSGARGHVLDTLARKALWDVGLNYGHGTGHGVGHFLNVHEGPSGIGSGQSATDPGIFAGTIFSNEPGFYEVGEYGIRHEDLVEVILLNEDSDHIYASSLLGDFGGSGALGFYTISLAPHQRACINVSLLNEHEIQYLNNYHARVLSTLGPILLQRSLTEDYNFLERECAPIYKDAGSSAILIRVSPILAEVYLFDSNTRRSIGAEQYNAGNAAGQPLSTNYTNKIPESNNKVYAFICQKLYDACYEIVCILINQEKKPTV